VDAVIVGMMNSQDIDIVAAWEKVFEN